MKRYLGIDIGSTSIKFVILDEAQNVLYHSYDRHKSQARQVCLDKLKEVKPLLEDHQIYVSMSGSSGLGIANDAGLNFSQEVYAESVLVRQRYPQANAIVELGGEDAKLVFMDKVVDSRMNSTCAGGTGAFIDQMASLLNITLEEMDALALQAKMLYPVASRCGVFAKTDVQALLNQGVCKPDLCASIFQAVVNQFVSGLAQGRKIEGTVIFLGGPASFMKGLQQRFKATLKLDEDHAIFPQEGIYSVAWGAALCAMNLREGYHYDQLEKLFESVCAIKHTDESEPPLFANKQQYYDFVNRHNLGSIELADISQYHGNAWLGIDAGSTTIKVVLLSESNDILYQYYASNEGKLLELIKEQLIKVRKLTDQYGITIVASGVCGYGETLIKNAFHVDLGVVETYAHYTAAKHFNPDVSFIIDIGGQDIKCFKIKDHAIDEVILNEACSSGCGSFIETFATSMGYSVVDFANLGLKSTHPVSLGTRCTVFMNSSVKQAQKNGATIEDISAGLCRSVVKNALYKVIRVRSVDELGDHVVVQGGTFLNNTILRCFEMELNKTVTRPNIAHLMGAFGCALLSRQLHQDQSNLLSLDQLNAFECDVRSFHCQACGNQCYLTIHTFKDGSRYVAGNKCDRFNNVNKKNELPNLYDYKYQYIRGLNHGNHGANRPTVGLPMALNMYELAPLWNGFFDALQFNVVFSDESSKSLYEKAQFTIPSDTVCYPAKYMHGHIQNLLDKKVDAIFYPCMTYNIEENSGKNYNCPVVAYYPNVIDANLEMGKTTLLMPYLDINNADYVVEKLYEVVRPLDPLVTLDQVKMAFAKGFDDLTTYHRSIYDHGKKAIEYAKTHDLQTIILAGRPYHIDPMIHHGIAGLLNALDFVVVSEDAVAHDETEPQVNVLNQWAFHSRLYKAAQFVNEHDHMQLIQLVSFGCGIDAVTTDEVRVILRRKDKFYTQIKIDEVDNLGAVTIRCRSLKAAINEKEGTLWKE